MAEYKKKKENMLPILLGVGAILVIIVVVLLLAFGTKSDEVKQEGTDAQTAPVKGPVEEAADDGVLKDYEESGNIVLGDYSRFVEKEKKENSDDWGMLVWDDYLATCTLKSYPEGAVEEALRDLHMQYYDFAEASGVTYEELLREYGTDEASLKELAEETVLSRMAAKTIAFREHMTIDPAKEADYLMTIMGYDEEDRETTKALYEAYFETYGCRPKDDIYVEMARELLVSRTVEG